jgi:hypothetical protein
LTGEDLNIGRAQLGIDAEAFVASNIGRYLLNRAADEDDELIDQLIHCKSTDVELNTEIRNKLQVTEMFRNWLSEAVNSGKIAHQTLEEQEVFDE